MIMLGKYKQGEVWMEGAGNVPCPEVCRHQDKYQLKDGYLIPANNQFLALSPTTKYSIVPAKGERIVVTCILLRLRQDYLCPRKCSNSLFGNL